MPSARWHDFSNSEPSKGDICFVVTTHDTSSGREYYEARSEPWKTNQSHEERLRGWLGETNNKSRRAQGRARITSVQRDGALVRFAFLPAKRRWEKTG